MNTVSRHGAAGVQMLILLAIVLAAASTHGAQPLILGPEAPVRDLAPYVEYLEDPDGVLTLSQVVASARNFDPLPGGRVDFGFSDSAFWLRLRLENPQDQPAHRLLAFNTRFMQRLDAWLVPPLTTEPTFRNQIDTPFSARDIPHRHVTTRITLPARSQRMLYVRYASEGTTALPLSIETALSFAELSNLHAVKNTAFYAFTGFMLACCALVLALLRSSIVVYYSLYLLSVTIYALHMDGLTFRYLWPEAPVWNSFAALPLGLVFTFFAALFSQAFLETRDRHPAAHRVLNATLAAALILMLSPLVIDTALAKRLAFPFTMAAALIFLGCGLAALRSGQAGVRFYVIGWTGITLAALVANFAHWSAGLVAVGMSFEVMRIGILVDATMMAMAILDRLNGIRRERDAAIEHESVMLEEMLSLHDRFLALENRYAMARSLADARGLQLATAGHDLRQPLDALRGALQNLKHRDDQESGTTRHLRSTITYLEQLVEGVMDSATNQPAPHGGEDIPVESGVETFPAQLILDNVTRMFDAEAAGRGVRLRSVETRVSVRADPLATMRIVSNLVSNAVRYTNGDRVLIGCRRRGSQVEIAVADAGPGMDKLELDRITGPWVRGAQGGQDSGGHGLGLSIVADLAGRHGYVYRIESRPGHGTLACLGIPAA